ncbi:MAG: hypothetical protein MUF54_17645, partial [Polyangiaceae bacterium]|nr:hypothetical protein [Polyangiaceae bacterium]
MRRRTSAARIVLLKHVSDENGKLAGEALLAGLHLLALGDPDEAMALREGMDYKARALAYDERRHEVQPGVEPNRYGGSRMWYFRSLRRALRGLTSDRGCPKTLPCKSDCSCRASSTYSTPKWLSPRCGC